MTPFHRSDTSCGFLAEIGYRAVLASPTRLMVDAKNVLTLVHNFESSRQQTRHITRRELIVREREVEGHQVEA